MHFSPHLYQAAAKRHTYHSDKDPANDFDDKHAKRVVGHSKEREQNLVNRDPQQALPTAGAPPPKSGYSNTSGSEGFSTDQGLF